ncbi:hypothetical protein AWP96_01705 [Escherichia coli]|nr:hypothetical protein AWP96_01705 [Escherichia coli]
MLPSETMIWQPEFTDKTLSRKPGAVQQTENPEIGIFMRTCRIHYSYPHGIILRNRTELRLRTSLHTALSSAIKIALSGSSTGS